MGKGDIRVEGENGERHGMGAKGAEARDESPEFGEEDV